MYRRNQVAVKPRNGSVLVVGIVARISGCANQKELSLDDQIDHGKQTIAELYDGPVEYRPIATRAKGERLDRPELEQIEAEFRRGELDLCVLEDLGRLVRGTESVRLLGVAVDNGVRVVVPNDCIDTAEATWEEDAISACRDHVGHNAHTSKRIKHKAMNRFVKFGGAMALPIAGYIVPENVKTYDDWLKDTSAEGWIREAAQRLRTALNCSAVAEWLNANQIRVGPYCRRATWNGAMVRKFFGNPLLKGMPARGFLHTVKCNEDGRRKSVRNPEGPVYRDCPQLAFLSPVEFDELNALLKTRNARYKRPSHNGKDPLLAIPRKRTRFPGQHAVCHYCGRQYVWGGNGVTDHLMCSGSRAWACWNSIGFDGPLAAHRLSQAIVEKLNHLPGIEEQYRDLVTQAARDREGQCGQRLRHLNSETNALMAQKNNISNAIATAGLKPLLLEKLEQLEAAERRLQAERAAVNRFVAAHVVIPPSTSELRRMFEESIASLAVDSYEFADLLRTIVPEFRVFLVRLCDGGHLLPRAQVKLAFDGIAPDCRLVSGISDLLTFDVTLDLFDPPQRARIWAEAVALAAQGLGPTAIASRIEEHPTATAVQHALELDRQMRALGLSSPYVLMTEPPADYAKLRRHRNSKYKFSPATGYVPPPL